MSMTSEDFGARAFEVAAGLSFPRLVGSAGEREAREKVVDAFRAAGLETEPEEFGCTDFAIRVAARWAVVPTGAALMLAVLFLHLGFPVIAMVLAAASLVPAAYVSSKAGAGFHDPHRRARFRTANVVGRIPGQSERGPLVILMAHYDSKSQVFPIWLRVLLFIIAGAGSIVIMMLTIACAILAMLGVECPLASALPYAAAALLMVDLSFLLNTVGNRSDGALDNATGVGIVAEIAGRLAAEPPKGVRIVALATAAEEIGLCGANAFIETHSAGLDKSSTTIINFDGCGAGRAMGVLAAHGVSRRRAPDDLVALAREGARLCGVPLNEHYIPVGMATDLMPFLRAGFRGIDFIGMAGGSHTPGDRVSLVNEVCLSDCVKVGLHVAVGVAGRT